jgi:hypothetical protein
VERVEMPAAGLAVVAFLFAGIFLPIAVLPGWLATVGRPFPSTRSRPQASAVTPTTASLQTRYAGTLRTASAPPAPRPGRPAPPVGR